MEQALCGDLLREWGLTMLSAIVDYHETHAAELPLAWRGFMGVICKDAKGMFACLRNKEKGEGDD